MTVSSLAMAVVALATFVSITHCVPVEVPTTSYDPCAITECPTLASSYGSSGSGEEPDNSRQTPSRYALTTNKVWTTQGQVIEVKLQFKECMPFSEKSSNGPTWYMLDAVSEDTGETMGEFFPPAFNGESSLCPNNAISFLTTVPTVLDVPRRYRWKPNSLKTVCFRATIFHHNDSTCETVSQCVSDIPPIPTSAPKVPIILPPLPTQKKVERCEAKWQCDLPKYRNIEYCGCDKVTKTCKTYAKKCEIRKEECIYQKSMTKTAGACIPEPPSQAPPTTPPPTQPPVLGNCIKFNSSRQCTTTGDYKSTQCDRQADGSHKCFCMSYDGIRYTDTEVIVTGCESTNSYDLRCVR